MIWELGGVDYYGCAEKAFSVADWVLPAVAAALIFWLSGEPMCLPGKQMSLLPQVRVLRDYGMPKTALIMLSTWI